MRQEETANAILGGETSFFPLKYKQSIEKTYTFLYFKKKLRKDLYIEKKSNDVNLYGSRGIFSRRI
ncbi:hypothetical protein Back11_10590 [Paenibacillus baekrokdamisoli]|uniref:Uncharacterized protein n=1 Tax=Paenibacillus baekrokdamisoli TaxID=1712516 RepID=A0A3G9J8W8_9BACL|nr:hypothetical protein Back11_10590 [Paenibacillus baekrokdamisoli]